MYVCCKRPCTEVQAADGALLLHEGDGEWIVNEHLQHLTACTMEYVYWQPWSLAMVYGVHTCPFLSPTNIVSLPGGPPNTLI